MGLRIILADDHPVVTIGARSVIDASGIGEVVAQAFSTDELMHVLSVTHCDVLVTDFAMPGGQAPDGFVMIQAIRRRFPQLPIVLLSMAGNIGAYLMAANIGVLGLLDKASSLNQLPMAIQAAYLGTPYISQSLREMVEQARLAPVAQTELSLTPREREVLRLWATGQSVSAIAKALNRGVTTISRQKNDAMRKLGLANDAELFRFLRDSGFF